MSADPRDTRCVITVDCGNTMVKAVAWHGSVPVARIAGASTGIAELRRLSGGVAPYGVAVCSVAAPSGALISALRRLSPARMLEISHLTPFPLRIDYATPRSLGLDRIAAACACLARFPGKALLVVDAGTAVTLDIVTADGAFAGGDIAPGLSLRFSSLHDHTSRLPLVKAEGQLPCFGRDTDSAIRCGVVGGVIAQIERSFRLARDIYGVSDIVLSGGDAPFLHPLLLDAGLPVSVFPDMVSAGILEIFNYSES